MRKDACSISSIHLRLMHSRVLTLVQSLPLQCFTDILLLGPSHMPVRQSRLRCGRPPHTHKPLDISCCCMFEVHARGKQILRLTTFLTNTFQLMTSCDFGAPHFPIPMRHVEQKQGSNILHLGSQKEIKCKKCSWKTLEQSMAIRLPLRSFYRSMFQISSRESYFPPKSRIENQKNHSFKIRIRNSRLQIPKV